LRVLVHGDLLPPRKELDALVRLIREVGMGAQEQYQVFQAILNGQCTYRVPDPARKGIKTDL